MCATSEAIMSFCLIKIGAGDWEKNPSSSSPVATYWASFKPLYENQPTNGKRETMASTVVNFGWCTEFGGISLLWSSVIWKVLFHIYNRFQDICIYMQHPLPQYIPFRKLTRLMSITIFKVRTHYFYGQPEGVCVYIFIYIYIYIHIYIYMYIIFVFFASSSQVGLQIKSFETLNQCIATDISFMDTRCSYFCHESHQIFPSLSPRPADLWAFSSPVHWVPWRISPETAPSNLQQASAIATIKNGPKIEKIVKNHRKNHV